MFAADSSPPDPQPLKMVNARNVKPRTKILSVVDCDAYQLSIPRSQKGSVVNAMSFRLIECFELMKIRSTLGVIKNQQAETLWKGSKAIEMPVGC